MAQINEPVTRRTMWKHVPDANARPACCRGARRGEPRSAFTRCIAPRRRLVRKQGALKRVNDVLSH